MIHIQGWSRTTKSSQRFSQEDLQQNRDHILASVDILWIDLVAPTPEEEELAFVQFYKIHTLSKEDIERPRRKASHQPHLPKVEEFDDYLFVIANALDQGYLKLLQEKQPREQHRIFTQFSAVLTAKVLITHHYEPMSCIDGTREYLSRHATVAERGPDYIFHLILDATVDQFGKALDAIDDNLDGVELVMLSNPNPDLFQSLLRLKREVIEMRKIFIHEREVLVRLSRGEFALVDERESFYYRNVYDHLVRFTELIDSSREMVMDLLQTYLAASSNKLNETMKVLTMISTAVLPMTLVAGVYGMNFDVMPELRHPLGYPLALGMMVAVGIGAVWFFKWRKWF